MKCTCDPFVKSHLTNEGGERILLFPTFFQVLVFHLIFIMFCALFMDMIFQHSFKSQIYIKFNTIYPHTSLVASDVCLGSIWRFKMHIKGLRRGPSSAGSSSPTNAGTPSRIWPRGAGERDTSGSACASGAGLGNERLWRCFLQMTSLGIYFHISIGLTVKKGGQRRFILSNRPHRVPPHRAEALASGPGTPSCGSGAPPC
jgi:hypothetical protein